MYRLIYNKVNSALLMAMIRKCMHDSNNCNVLPDYFLKLYSPQIDVMAFCGSDP